MLITDLYTHIKNQAASRAYAAPDDIAHFQQFSQIKDESIIRRILVERAIVRQAVSSILSAGAGKNEEFHELTGSTGHYCISVHDGEEYPVKKSRDLAQIMADIGQCDEETLVVRHATADGSTGIKVGSIYLVYGNDGWDVICDHTDSRCMHELLSEASHLADVLGELIHRDSAIA